MKQYGLENPALGLWSEVLMRYSERMMREAIARLPDGSYYAEDHIDGFLDHPARAARI